jgi:hypothetical protein
LQKESKKLITEYTYMEMGQWFLTTKD